MKESLANNHDAGGSGAKNRFRMHARSVFRRIFHLLLGIFPWLLHRLGIRRFREHSFFGALLRGPVVVADFGAHRGEFFAALKSEYSISKALLAEANPALAECLKEMFGAEAAVVHAAVVGGGRNRPITFICSIEPESSSIFREWAAVYGVADQVDVPAVDFAEALRELGGRVDLVKFDVEGAEVEVLETAVSSDLASCRQLSVEFHDKRPPFTRHDVDCVCQRMRSEGYSIVNASWPRVDDVLFVNLRAFASGRRLRFRCRMALVNALFIIRGAIFRGAALMGSDTACNLLNRT